MGKEIQPHSETIIFAFDEIINPEVRKTLKAVLEWDVNTNWLKAGIFSLKSVWGANSPSVSLLVDLGRKSIWFDLDARKSDSDVRISYAGVHNLQEIRFFMNERKVEIIGSKSSMITLTPHSCEIFIKDVRIEFQSDEGDRK